jgi:hypothetical protein
MKWFMIIAGAAMVLMIITALILFSWGVSISNAEIQQKNLVLAKQESNKNWLTECNNTISNAAEVTDAQRQALMDIIVGNAKARADGQGKGSLAAMVQEAVPNVDTSVYKNLLNIVTAKREGFKRVQDELIDLNRVHNVMLQTFPSSLVCSFLGRKEIEITVVTSTRTQKAFETGKDDDTGLNLKHN